MNETTPEKQVNTYCRICEAACGLTAVLHPNGRVAKLIPDKAHPVSQGYVCAKGTRFAKVASHPTRITRPMARGKDGRLHPVSWEEAMQQISTRLLPIIDQHGPHALGVYYGNPLLFNALGLIAQIRFNRLIGTRNVYSSFSQDCNNKFKGSQILHNAELVHPIPDLEHAKLALFFGFNPAVSQGSFVHLNGGATAFDRYTKRGGQSIWVDPRRTESAERWGEHLPIRPGTDIYLLLSLLHELSDLAHKQPAMPGLGDLLALAAEYPAEDTAVHTHIPAEKLQAIAQRIRRSPATTFHMSVGVNMGPFGTLAYIVMQAIAYVSGNLDQTGGILYHPLGQPLSKLLRRLNIGTRPQPSRVGQFTGVFDELPGGILADEILTPGPEQIRAMLVVSGNPVTSIPGEKRLKTAFEQLDFVISIDLFLNDTAEFADLVLPATSWLERFDLATTTATFQNASILQYGGPVQPAPGNVRHEHQILAGISLQLKRPLWRSARLTRWLITHPPDRALTRLLDIGLLPYRLRNNRVQGIPVPQPKAGRYLRRRQLTFWHEALASEPARLANWAEHDRRQQWGPEKPTPPAGVLPMRLISRRRRLGHNSWLHGAQRDGNSESIAWMAPADLQRLGLPDGGEITIRGNETVVSITAVPKPEISVGTIIVPHGLPDVNVNALLPSGPDFVEPISGNHLMTGLPVHISAQEAAVSQ